MKRMELKITLTFAIIFVVSVIISGIDSVVSKQTSFFTLMVDGFISALTYLAYIWINTRRHKLLALLGFVSILLMVIFVVFSTEGASDALISSWNWKNTINCIYYVVLYQIASYQSNKLLEEDEETLYGNNDIIPSEDVEIIP